MTGRTPSATREFAWLALSGGVAAAVLLAAGWLPTVRVAGAGGLFGLWAGVGTSFAASLAAAGVLVSVRSADPRARQLAAFGAMGVRMVLTLAVFATLVLTDIVPRRPLAVWTGVSYLALLAVETIGFVRILRTR
ncbi:MAG: hypothetical protein U1A27_10635 [Phycisphaerae bacterium]